jgi:hypothetical protein
VMFRKTEPRGAQLILLSNFAVPIIMEKLLESNQPQRESILDGYTDHFS